MQGLDYDVQTSDGANVGYNKDTTTTSTITYTWYAAKEGVYLFNDMGDATSSEDGTNIHGLFGAIIIEAAESTWLDPQTGQELQSGLFADIYNPAKPSFREYAVFFHDELEIKNKEGDNPTSTIIDSITISPQECYTLDILHGAGSLNGTIGDVIFHCHLYPHFHEGMWTLWRIHDRLEDGTGKLPDGPLFHQCH